MVCEPCCQHGVMLYLLFSDHVYYRWPIDVSADNRPIYQLTVDRLSVDSRPIVGRQVTDVSVTYGTHDPFSLLFK